MKRYGNLYDRIISYENLLEAFANASRHRSKRGDVVEFVANFNANILQIQDELINLTYKTSAYTTFIIFEPKPRLIYKLPFRDRVVQWAIMLVIEPIWLSNFTADTYSCIKGRGIHPLLHKLRQDLRKDVEGTRYCLKLDIRKFYPSISHEILKQVIRRKIKDPKLLQLLDGIIDSTEGTGVPIGNYLSQFFANLYLSELDHLLKEDLHLKYYYRFADDMVILSSDKEELHGVLVYMNDYLNSHRALDIKKNYQIFPVESRGINFVGYVTYHTHCLARKENKKKLCRQVASLRKKGLPENEVRLKSASRLGFMQHCDSIHLLKKINMLKFSDVRSDDGTLTGDKYHIDTILNRTIRLTAYRVSPSKYKGECLVIQYKIFEEVKDEKGNIIQDENGMPKKDWVEHVTFTGSETLANQLKGLQISEPIEAKIIKQSTGDKGRYFYKLTDPD